MPTRAFCTLAIPFHTDSRGGLGSVTTAHDVVRQQIADILATNHYERVMKPYYGADIRALLFSPVGAELAGIRASEIQALLQSYVKLAQIVRVLITPTNPGEARMRVDVSYTMFPDITVYTYSQVVSGMITEESM